MHIILFGRQLLDWLLYLIIPTRKQFCLFYLIKLTEYLMIITKYNVTSFIVYSFSTLQINFPISERELNFAGVIASFQSAIRLIPYSYFYLNWLIKRRNFSF